MVVRLVADSRLINLQTIITVFIIFLSCIHFNSAGSEVESNYNTSNENNSTLSWCPPMHELKIVFVTALIDDYEKSCKEPAIQTIPADFIAYTDSVFDNMAAPHREVAYNKWKRVNADSYRYGLLAPDNFTSFHNAMTNNQHSFNRAKVIKLNLHRLPELKPYHIVIWVDGTTVIRNNETAAIMAQYMCQEQRNFLVFEHGERGGLDDEVFMSMHMNRKIARYATTHFLNQDQPYQDVDKQYASYLAEGYRDDHFGRRPSNPKAFRSVFVTNFFALNMLRPETHQLCELWWMQNLIFTTQDQVSFTYALWKLGLLPYTFPDERIHGGSANNDLFEKSGHGHR